MKYLKITSAVTALVLSTSANASTVVYSDISSFTTATNSLTTVDFEGAWGATYTDFSSGYTSGDVTFTGNQYQYIGDYTTLNSSSNPYSAVGSDFLLGIGSDGYGITATFASGVTAVGLDFSLGETSGTTMTFTLGTGEQFNVASPTNYALNFFGITSDVAITSISWNAPSSRLIADNFVYETAAVVPVPAAVWLFGSGLLGLIGFARRKKA